MVIKKVLFCFYLYLGSTETGAGRQALRQPNSGKCDGGRPKCRSSVCLGPIPLIRTLIFPHYSALSWIFWCILWRCGMWGIHLHSWVHLAAEYILLRYSSDGEECRSFSSQVVCAHLLYICWQSCICSHRCRSSALETSLEILYFGSSKGIISNTGGPVCYAIFHSVRARVSSQFTMFFKLPPGIGAKKKEWSTFNFFFFVWV